MGCVHVVDVNQLLTLPEHFVRIPVQVVEVYVCGVRPCDRDQDWPEEVGVCVCVCVLVHVGAHLSNENVRKVTFVKHLPVVVLCSAACVLLT